MVLELDRIACQGLKPDTTILIDIDLAYPRDRDSAAFRELARTVNRALAFDA